MSSAHRVSAECPSSDRRVSSSVPPVSIKCCRVSNECPSSVVECDRHSMVSSSLDGQSTDTRRHSMDTRHHSMDTRRHSMDTRSHSMDTRRTLDVTRRTLDGHWTLDTRWDWWCRVSISHTHLYWGRTHIM